MELAAVMGMTLEKAEFLLDAEPFMKLAESYNIRVMGELQQAPYYIGLLIDKRSELRGAKDWALADKIRSSLLELGIILEDTPQETLWRYKR